MVKGIIFDLDGVILFTDEYHYIAWKNVADAEGIYFDRVINNRLRGVSRMQSLEIILEKANRVYTAEEKEQIAARKNQIYVELLREKLSPSAISEDVLFTLGQLRKQNVKVAIGSSSKNAKLILERVGLYDVFDFISDGNGITKSKPDPEVFLNAVKGLKLQPNDCLVVEDAVAGIEAAKAGGFTAIAIGDAHSCLKSDYKIKKLSDVLEIASNCQQ